LADQDPDAISLILDLIQQLEANLTAEQNTAQLSLNDISAFAACDAKMLTAMYTTNAQWATSNVTNMANADSTVASVTASREAVQTTGECITTLQIIQNQLTECQTKLTMLAETQAAVCRRFEDVDLTPTDGLAQKCREKYDGSYTNYLSRAVAKLDEYRGRKDNCTLAVNATSNTSTFCKTVQTNFTETYTSCISKITTLAPMVGDTTTLPTEGPACIYYHQREVACGTYSACLRSAERSKLAELASMQDDEEQRQTMWDVLEEIICIINKTYKSGENITAETALTMCDMTTFTASNPHSWTKVHAPLSLPIFGAAKSCVVGDPPSGCAVVSFSTGTTTTTTTRPSRLGSSTFSLGR